METPNSPEWWELLDKKALDYEARSRDKAAIIMNETEAIETRQFQWYELNLFNAALYTGRQLVGFRWGAEDVDVGELMPVNMRTENIIENVGQTMLAKAASSPLRPTLVPHGASWHTAKNVKLADKFVFGMWRQTDAENKALQMFNDSYTTGLGALQVTYSKHSKLLSVDSVFFDNIVIDNRECVNRAMPKTYRIRKPVHKTALEKLYKKSLKKSGKTYMPKRARGKDWEIVIELWRLPDDEKKGGYHAIIGCNEVLFEEEWNEDFVPLVFHHWTDRLSGFFVKGGVEQVIPYQLTQNELNESIRKAQKIGCHPAVMAPASTQFDWSQWDSENVGGILLYHGMEPKDLKISTNLAELYQERERNKAAAYSHMGLNEMFAMGDIAPQVRMDSSAGIREVRNMEDARHLRLWKSYEDARLNLAKTMMKVVAASKDKGFFSVYKPYAATTNGQKIAYEAICELTEDAYTWEMAPASLAQQSPAARRETLRDWKSRSEANTSGGEMTTNPDLERIERATIAEEEDIQRHIEILESGKFEAPDELTGLSKGMMMVRENYHVLLRYEDLKPNDPIILNHRRWLVTAAARVASMMPPTPQPGMTPYQPTQGVPGTSAAMT